MDPLRPDVSFSNKLLFIFIGAFLVISFLQRQYFLDTLLKIKTAPGAQNIATQPVGPSLPIHIKIPRIQVDATVQYVGLTPEGAMDVPSNSDDVGWYKLGPRPGEMGSAVIDGHIDGEDGSKGVFYLLHSLKPGDSIYVEDDKRKSITFIVQESRIYNSTDDVPDIFYKSDGMYLNIITCDGVWDGVTKSYSKRLVVFARAAGLGFEPRLPVSETGDLPLIYPANRKI